MKKQWDKYNRTGDIWENIMSYALNFFGIIFVIIFGLFKLIWRFVKDVTSSFYKLAVTFIATGILAYLISHFVVNK